MRGGIMDASVALDALDDEITTPVPVQTDPARVRPRNDNGRDPDVVEADEVAAMLGLNRKTVYEAAGRGDLPARRVGRRLLFSRTAVLEWLQCKGSSERSL